jgi:hypothetical protein
MKNKVRDRLSKRFRLAAMAIVAIGTVAATTVHAIPPSDIVLVPPTELPAWARKTGEATFLHETIDGRTLLYIEPNPGTRLATFDVTDPAQITGESSVQFDAPGPIDFVSPLEIHAEHVRFPNLKPVQGLTLQGPITYLNNDGFTVTHQAAGVAPARNYRVVDTVNSQEFNRVFDVNQVREDTAKADTGIAFMLTENGVYVIRRPAVESNYRMMMIPPN